MNPHPQISSPGVLPFTPRPHNAIKPGELRIRRAYFMRAKKSVAMTYGAVVRADNLAVRARTGADNSTVRAPPKMAEAPRLPQ